MQKKLAVFLITTIFFFGFSSVSETIAKTGSNVEKIKNFNVNITINKDSSLLLEENIVYDFGENLKHGIYRDIPLKGIKVKVLDVADKFGKSYPFKTYKKKNYLRIKIGDSDNLIKGEHDYNILYIVQRGIGYFKKYDELYWNITGNGWKVPIEKSSAIIHLPEQISKEGFKMDCFTGIFGSKEKNCSFKLNGNGDVYFQSERTLLPKEGLTMVLGWPKGIVKESFFQKYLWWLNDFWPIFIPIFVFIFLFKKWWEKGKDPRLQKTIIAQYEPPDNLRPAEVSLIVKQRVRARDISATLIDLAVRGYIKIKEIKKHGFFGRDDYELIKLKDFNNPKNNLQNNLRQYEIYLLESVFGFQEKKLLSELRKLRKKFSSRLNKVANEIYSEITGFKYFVSNPKKTTTKWKVIGLFIIVLGAFIPSYFKTFLGYSIVFSGLLFLIFALLMPKKTEKGTETYWRILGFKEYINTAEKYRLQFQEKENIFEKYLPYAIIFGLTKKWAKAFEGIYTNSPSWYEGKFGPRFSSYIFVASLDKTLSNFNNTFSSRAGGRSSGFGGGSSGGGGGGGGGGSW